MLAAASASSDSGPSVSGKPCPRLIAPVRRASADISAKIVDVNGRMRSTSMGSRYGGDPERLTGSPARTRAPAGSTRAPARGTHWTRRPERTILAPMSPPNIAHLTAELTRAGVVGVTIAWADNNGIPRSRIVPVAALPTAATAGVGVTSLFAVFDSRDAITYGHPGLATPSGDVRLVPVLDRLVRLAGQPALAWAPGRQVTDAGDPWPYDQRAVLERQVAALAGDGLSVRIGYEMEFGVYRAGDEPEPVAAHTGPAYSPHALLPLDGFVADVLRDCAANGLGIGQLHAEYGPAQLEISLAATDPVKAADQQLLARQTLHAAAARNGLRLSFAPLPSAASAGHGWHIHSPVWRAGRTLLAGGPEGPGTDGAAWIAGLLRDLPALAALTAPSLGSLARLRPGYFAGAYTFWGVQNREAPLRYVPGSALLGADHANVELNASY